MQIDEGSNVGELVLLLHLAPEGIAIALNGEVVPREDWVGAFLKEEDSVEIVHAVQGG